MYKKMTEDPFLITLKNMENNPNILGDSKNLK
jgi:hypothetical protein